MTPDPRMAAGLALTIVLLSLTPAAAARTETASYVTGADVAVSCEDELVGGAVDRNVGATCFDVQAGESQVDIAIDDGLVDPVGGALQFLDANGGQLGDFVGFCGSIAGEPIPSQAVTVRVLVDGPVFQLVDCGDPGTSTTGTVEATFS